MRRSNHLPRVWHPYPHSTLKSSSGWTMVIPSKDLPTYTKKTYAKSCIKDKKKRHVPFSPPPLYTPTKFPSCLLRNCEGLLFAHFFLKAFLTVGAVPDFVIYIVDFSHSVLEHEIIAVTAKCQAWLCNSLRSLGTKRQIAVKCSIAHDHTLPYCMTSLFPKWRISNVVALSSKMAEAAVESQSDRFYCHECNREVSLNFPVCIKTLLFIWSIFWLNPWIISYVNLL